MESQEENSVRQKDLLERSAFLEMGDDGVSKTPEENVYEEGNACAQSKTKESVRTMSQLRKLSSTNPAGAKELSPSILHDVSRPALGPARAERWTQGLRLLLLAFRLLHSEYRTPGDPRPLRVRFRL